MIALAQLAKLDTTQTKGCLSALAQFRAMSAGPPTEPASSKVPTSAAASTVGGSRQGPVPPRRSAAEGSPPCTPERPMSRTSPGLRTGSEAQGSPDSTQLRGFFEAQAELLKSMHLLNIKRLLNNLLSQ